MGVEVKKTIVLDSDAFSVAAADYKVLSEEMTQLCKDIETALNKLEAGFDTPAGRLFIHSYTQGLESELKKQRDVLELVSNVLSTSKEKYQTIFDAHNTLKTEIDLATDSIH